jgi:hypothetical protein
MDWTNASHVLQAIYWTVMFLIFIKGYTVGKTLV